PGSLVSRGVDARAEGRDGRACAPSLDRPGQGRTFDATPVHADDGRRGADRAVRRGDARPPWRGAAGEGPEPAGPRADAARRRRGGGGGGDVKVLWWQGPTILTPHLSIGVKDGDGSRIFYEPLISFDPEGNYVPVLAAEVPTLQNGGIARDGTSVTWKIKR